jgi:outer membrane protein assembly factor BamA
LFPRILRFDSGDVYNRKDHNLTLNRLINLDVFKFVKNRFEISPQTSEADTGRLNAFYYLTPQPKKSLRAELSGNTKSNNYVGSLVRFTFRNRNSFRGAEQLEIHANVGSEVQYSGTNSGFNSFRLGAGLGFSIPRFVVPFFKFNTTSAYVPRTRIGLDYEILNRQKLYTLTSVRGELGYVWKPEVRKEHQFNPIAINYVEPLNITPLYLDSIKRDLTLRQAIDTQFIIGSNYTYTFDQLINDPKGTGFFFSGNIDLSGNIAGLVTGANIKDGNQKRIFGAPFSQYIKTQADFRYYHAVSTKTRLANRIILGLGYPYGNSLQMPFIKQFFIGGNNSIRAFRSRSVGPGTYINRRAIDDSSNNFLPDQSGDIKIELNTELRYKFTSIIEGALFVDAGNIWLYNEHPDKPGAKFTKNFIKEFAVGAGAGIRLDLTILLLRIDAAVPIRKPYLPLGQRRVKDVNTSNIVYNIGIGYPF